MWSRCPARCRPRRCTRLRLPGRLGRWRAGPRPRWRSPPSKSLCTTAGAANNDQHSTRNSIFPIFPIEFILKMGFSLFTLPPLCQWTWSVPAASGWPLKRHSKVTVSPSQQRKCLSGWTTLGAVRTPLVQTNQNQNLKNAQNWIGWENPPSSLTPHRRQVQAFRGWAAAWFRERREPIRSMNKTISFFFFFFFSLMTTHSRPFART